MGLKSAVLLALGTLGMGTTEETFQLEGGRQQRMEKLKSLVTEGAITSAVDFNMRADTPSGPLAFDVSIDLSKLHTSSSVHSSSGGHSWPSIALVIIVEIGWQEVLKHILKKSFKELAFSVSDGHGRLLCVKEPP